MQVNKWGPGGWAFMHTITFNYPLNPTDDDKQHYKNFFQSLKYILPCNYCRISITSYIKHIPIEPFLDDIYGLTYWLFIIHNLINVKLGNKTESFDKIVERYEGYRAKCGKMTNENKKEILTCQIKVADVDKIYVDNFVNTAYNKYSTLLDKYICNLYDSDDNPNKKL